MKNKKLLLLVLLFSGPAFATETAPAAKAAPSSKMIETFSNDTPGKFPSNFKTYPFQRGKAEEIYVVNKEGGEEGGNKFLTGTEKNDYSIQALRRAAWDRSQYPVASWKWRAKVLPAGAAENNPATNDSACGVYVVFGGYTGKVLKYVWSATLPEGAVVPKKPGKFYFIVKNSGPKDLNAWQTVRVNVVEDFKKAFGEDPDKDPNGFGVLTDGNATHTPSSCDYDDFAIHSQGEMPLSP